MLGSIDCSIDGVGLFVGTALGRNENEGTIVEPSVGNTEGTGEAYNWVGLEVMKEYNLILMWEGMQEDTRESVMELLSAYRRKIYQWGKMKGLSRGLSSERLSAVQSALHLGRYSGNWLAWRWELHLDRKKDQMMEQR